MSNTYGARVTDDGGGESSGTGALARGVHAYGRHLLHKLQQLGLGRAWVSQQQDIDVATPRQTIWKALAGSWTM